MNRKLTQSWLGGLVGAGVTILLGVVCWFPVGEGLTRLSYDLLYLFRADIRTEEAVIVYLDDQSHDDLKQTYGKAWDRSLHARLLDRLTADQVKAVVFDVALAFPGTSVEEKDADERLIQAVQNNGKVLFAALYVPLDEPGLTGMKLERPFQALRKASAGWGIATLDADPDRVAIRRLRPGTEEEPSLAWQAAKRVGAPVANSPAQNFRMRWLNYYGPPGTIPGASYAKTLAPREVSSEFFRGKVVFIGDRPTAGFSGARREEFANPYTLFTGKYSPGVEVHATAFLNLVRGDWLNRFPAAVEILILLIAGCGFGYGLAPFQPSKAAGLALAGMAGVSVLAWVLAWRGQVWFPWMLIAGVQIPAAFVWSAIYNSMQNYIHKRLLEQSLSMYVSVPRAKQLLQRPELLQPGAEQIEVSILFSDIAKFSTITQRMLAKDLVKLLNDYFEIAIQCIHQPEGTVMKLIGDAIFAIWNAPEPQPNHQERACRAALLLREKLCQFDVTHQTLPLRTRVGLHSGLAYVGNFGSASRFDYTAIGDSINLASRLEGLNKHLETEIVDSREMLSEEEGLFVTCLAGHFKLKGFDRVMEVHELLGTQEVDEATRPWREVFLEGMHKFQRHDFDRAERAFRRTTELRPNQGPAQFYLQRIKEFRVQPPPEDWTGEIDLKEK